MPDVTRNSYSLYKRETGSRTIWYVRFWNDDTQSYSSGRSTGQTTKPAAHRQVKNGWQREFQKPKRKTSKPLKID